MRRLPRVALLVCALLAVPITASAAPVTVTNGTQFTDTSGKVVHAHGGGMTKVGSYYYWFGENRNADNTFKAVSVYRSTDLKTWEFRNNVLTSSSAAELGRRARPREHRTAEGRLQQLHRPVRHVDAQGERPELHRGQGGRRHLVHSGRQLHVPRQLPPARSAHVPRHHVVQGRRRSGLHGLRRDGVYFMVTSGSTYWNPNQQKYATASSLTGTWSGLSNLGDSTGYRSQTAYVQPVQGSSATSYLYLGDRWAGAWNRPVNESQYVWLPLKFPTRTTVTMTWYKRISVDAATGIVNGL